MPELKAGTALVVLIPYGTRTDDWICIGDILYVVSDIVNKVDSVTSGFYWQIDILNPVNGKISTWYRSIREELIEDIIHYHTLIDNE